MRTSRLIGRACRLTTQLTCLTALVVGASAGSAFAVSNLSCGGLMHFYPPEEPMDLNVPPGASSVDFPNNKIVTPMGEFRLSRIDEQQITFDAPATSSFNYVTRGTLDRSSGRMQIMWLRPEQDAKTRAVGQSAQMARYAEFICVAVNGAILTR